MTTDVELDQLPISLVRMRTLFASLRQRRKQEQSNVMRLRDQVTKIEEMKAQLLKATALIDGGIRVVSANGIGTIETLVTHGLQLVFNDPTLALVVAKKESVRGNSHSLEIKEGDVQGPPLETFGGGIVNMAALLLRVILINRFGLAKLLVVDESFNNVSAEYLPMVSELLRQLAIARGYRILAVTHQPILAVAADHVYRVIPGQEKGDPSTLHKLTPLERALIRRANPDEVLG
jgi:DNA repair ATPase RecN